MDSKEELISSFEFINVVLDDKVLNRCMTLCDLYNIEPEEFVNIWCSYAASTMDADNTDGPTLEKLEIMEKKQLQKYSKEKAQTPARTPQRARNENNQHDEKRSSTARPTNGDYHMEVTMEVENVPEPAAEVLDVSITNHLSSTQGKGKYTERTNALSVRVSIGKHQESPNRTTKPSIELLNEDCFLHANAKYMYEVMRQKMSSLDNMTNSLGESIAKKNNLYLPTDVSTKNHIGPIITYGKIYADGKGHLNLQSIMLEGTNKMNSGHSVHLNVDKISKNVVLFPGQVVVVKGKMISGNKLIAENIISNVGLELPPEPPVVEDPLRIILASGPFTLNENINYDPMRDLLNYVAEKQPHILILMGPFLEETHPMVSNSDMVESFDVFFENLIESISAALQDMPIQIVILSSMKDVHHHNVYPTPPYETRMKHSNIKFFPDPCVLKIDGLVLAATTADIMYHIAKEELVTNKNSDTMTRLASHLIQQQSFYPLYPPNAEVNVSHQFLESYGTMECLPHFLVLPSTFRGFIRNINGCVVLNPERLTRGNGGGAFADITISAGPLPFSDRVHCKIIDI